MNVALLVGAMSGMIKQILESLPSGVILFDEQFNILDVNRTAADILGDSPKKTQRPTARIALARRI